MNPFDAASPLDARYYFAEAGFFERLHPYVSENAQVQYLARVEAALAHTLAEFGIGTDQSADEISRACAVVTSEEVYDEERRIQHNIRALVNCIRRRLSPAARPYVHLFATSNDIMDTAKALCLKDVTQAVLLPDLVELEQQLIALARSSAEVAQMGRTHGQHAVPITFGFSVALYVSRLGQRIKFIEQAADNLRGKFAGAVGAYNALSLFQKENPQALEAALMRRLDLKAPEISNQIVQPEYVTDFVYTLASTWGIFANIADDYRHLQRSEIREIRDRKATDPNAAVVGSSTMPHKVNPKDFENVKSLWKAYMPRLMTVLMDQITEHQRDLTNSASGRFVMEFVTAFAYSIYRLRGALASIEPDAERMQQLLDEGKDPIAAEPLYVLLSLAGHPDAHEQARVLAREARIRKCSLAEVFKEEETLQSYLEKISPEQLQILEDPTKYRGAAAQRALAICAEWEKEIVQLRRKIG